MSIRLLSQVRSSLLRDDHRFAQIRSVVSQGAGLAICAPIANINQTYYCMPVLMASLTSALTDRAANTVATLGGTIYIFLRSDLTTAVTAGNHELAAGLLWSCFPTVSVTRMHRFHTQALIPRCYTLH